MSRQNPSPGRAQGLRSGDEFRVLQRKNLTSDDATESEPAGDTEEKNQRPDRQLRPRHQHAEQQQQSWYGEESIEHAHHYAVDQSSQISRDRSVSDAEGETHDRCQYP